MKTQSNSLYELAKILTDEQACLTYLEKLRWPNGVVSPFNPSSKVYNYGGGLYRCKATGLNFTARTNTIFHGTKLPLSKWFMAIWLITSHKKGISSMQLSRDIHVTQKTAWFMLHRIRQYCFCENNTKLRNVIELDETLVGGKNKNRHANKKVKHSQGRSCKDKAVVFGLKERGRDGKLVCRVVKDSTAKYLTRHILRHANIKAKLYTDKWSGYNTVGRWYSRSVVDHNKKEYVRGDTHTNTIEGVWGLFKRSLFGIYHLVSRKYLQNYANELAFRYNTKTMDDGDRFDLLLSNANYRITNKEISKLGIIN